MSCPSRGSCVAAGTYADTGSNQWGVIETLSGGSWIATTAPVAGLNPAVGADPTVSLLNLACPTSTSCVAVGSYEDAAGAKEGLIESLSAGTWTAQSTPLAGLSRAAASNPAVDFGASISCPTRSSCVSVGSYSDTSGNQQGFIETLSGGSWSATTTPLVGLYPPSAANPGVTLANVSCPSVGSCVAVGSYISTAGGPYSPEGLIETLSDGAWSATIAPTAGLSEVGMAFVSCPAMGSCVAWALGNEPSRPEISTVLIENQSVAMPGYWELASDGGIFSFGGANFYGSMGGIPLNAPIVGMTATPDAKGYWLVASDGGVFAFGNANFYGSMGGKTLNAPVVGIAVTPDGGGYWLVASDGGIFSFGNANFYGSMGGKPLNKPIVDIAVTPDGGGYWEVASDGGIFSFGDAYFYGSMGGQHLNRPVVGTAATSDGGGYWEVASDGGIFSFGDATFGGSMGGQHRTRPWWGLLRVD